MRINNITTILIITLFLSSCKSPQEKLIEYSLVQNHEAVTPVIQKAPWAQSWWMKRHNEILERNSKEETELVFIGNSIIHHWEDTGKESWNRYFGKYNPVNMGFGGDQTQHVLWRIENGELEYIKPKTAVIMIGTNNVSAGHSAEMIADGVIRIVSKVREELPETKILLLDIFPRDSLNSESRITNQKASRLFAEISDDKYVFSENINDIFLDNNGEIPLELMPDKLHPNAEGYKLWAEAIEDNILNMLTD